MNNKLTGLGANHPANGPLTTERLGHVRDVLQRNLQYSNGGNMDYIIADAVKAIDELLAGRKAEPMAWLWTNERLDKQSVSLTDPADDENTLDAMACGWKHQHLYTAPPSPVPEGEWGIDHSAGRPILVYKGCSVIEAEDAEYVLSLIAKDGGRVATLKEGQILSDSDVNRFGKFLAKKDGVGI